MQLNWNDQKTHDDHYSGRIGWPDKDDPIPNDKGQRIGQTYHYGRDFARYAQRGPAPYWFYLKRVAALITSFGIKPEHRIAIIGCGFGYIVYCFRHASLHPGVDHDYPKCWGIDSSAYIQANWDKERLGDEDAVFDDWTKILDGDQLRDKFEALTGDYLFDFIVNFVIESCPDLSQMFEACEAGLAGADTRRIVHIVDNELRPRGKDDQGNTIYETGDEPYYQTLRDYGTTLMTLDDWATLKPTHSWIGARSSKVIMGVLA